MQSTGKNKYGVVWIPREINTTSIAIYTKEGPNNTPKDISGGVLKLLEAIIYIQLVKKPIESLNLDSTHRAGICHVAFTNLMAYINQTKEK